MGAGRMCGRIGHGLFVLFETEKLNPGFRFGGFVADGMEGLHDLLELRDRHPVAGYAMIAARDADTIRIECFFCLLRVIVDPVGRDPILDPAFPRRKVDDVNGAVELCLKAALLRPLVLVEIAVADAFPRALDGEPTLFFPLP
ncbi:MAG: hypothetical protein WDN28_22680 [Chthoniobacter sp.]